MTKKLTEEFIKTKINPIVGYLVHSGAGARMMGLPDSADWEYLREGTRRIVELLEGELNKLTPEPVTNEAAREFVPVMLPLPKWEPDGDDAITWSYTRQSASLYCRYWISLKNFKCYQTTDNGQSWPISSAVIVKSLNEAKAICWDHYLGELGAKAAEIFGRVPEHKDEIAGLKQVIELRANAEKRKQQIARQAEELNNWRTWAIGELSDEANALEEDDNAELRRKLSFVLSELANMTCQSDEIEELKAERDQLHKTREQLQLQQWHGSVVKLAKELGWDDASEQTISEWLRAKLSPPQPEVIEGRGQAVGESGRWLEQPSTGSIICVWLTREDVFQEGCRYMRCPTFPPLGSK